MVVNTPSALRVAVLGPCSVEHGARDITPSSALQRRLLTLLAVRSPGPASVESLMDVAWPRAERPKDPRQNLHTHMSRLRRHLDEGAGAPSAIMTEPEGYRLDPSVITTDLRELSDLTRDGVTPEATVDVGRLDRALSLWRGPSLIDIVDSDDGVVEASRLDELRLSLMESRFERLLDGPPDPALIAELDAFTTDHPYRERPHAVLMEVLYHLGRQADALAAFQRLRTRLGEDLGLEPSLALCELESQILRHELAERRSPPKVALTERDAVPPEPMSRPPRPVTVLRGREAELDQLRSAVARSRLVTIIGPGGVGKTRIATELAQDLAEGSATAPVWCDLTTATSDPELIDVVALALQVRRQGRQTARQAVMSMIASIEPVLFLDNCEHVADAAAAMVVDLLAHAPARIVATARAPLDVPGEELVRLSPMSWQSSSTSELPPAVALLRERAAAAGAVLDTDRRTDQVLAQVCRAVDGLPLGIELAAAQLRNMGLDELAEEVTSSSGALDVGRRSGAHRHRSIRSALEWSLDSLDTAARQVFTGISVFSGSFGASGAAVVADVPREADVAQQLRSLSDLSLLTVETVDGRSRFRSLQTARRIGQERAEGDGSAAGLLDRHRRWVLDLVQEMEPLFRGPAEQTAVRAIEAEIDEIRAVVRRAVDQADADTALTIAASLSDFGMHRMRDDVADWAGAALSMDGATEHPLRASAMATVALVATNRGDLSTAEDLASAVLDLEAPAINAVLVAHHALSLVALYSGELADAVQVADRQLRLAESAREPFYGQIACLVAGLAELYGGNPDRAMELADRASTFANRTGAPTSSAWSDYLLGEVLADRDPVRAGSLFRSAIAAGESVHNPLVTGVARLSLTTLPIEVGHERDALDVYRQLIERWQTHNDWTHQWTTLQNLAPLLARCGADVDAAVLLGALTTDERASHLFGETAEALAALGEELDGRIGTDRSRELRSSGAALSSSETLDHALVAIDALLDGST